MKNKFFISLIKNKFLPAHPEISKRPSIGGLLHRAHTIANQKRPYVKYVF